MAESKVKRAAGYAVDPARTEFSGKTVDAIAVVDILNYTNIDGYPASAGRGDEVQLPEEEWKRLGVRSKEQLAKFDYPAVVKPSHPHVDFLSKTISAAEHPDVARVKLMQAHGVDTGLGLTPAGVSAHEPSTLSAPADLQTGLSVNWSELSKAHLLAVAGAAGIEDASSMTKDELVAALSSAQSSAGVTPRVSTSSATYGPETPAESAGDGS